MHGAALSLNCSVFLPNLVQFNHLASDEIQLSSNSYSLYLTWIVEATNPVWIIRYFTASASVGCSTNGRIHNG